MRGAVVLGCRLAIGTRGQRARSAMTVATSSVGAVVLLLVWGVADSQVGTTTAFNSTEVSILIAGTIGMVALPVLVLVATIARLSAAVRERRLSNLRLLGLSATQTRMVAATEVGAASAVGTTIGVVATLALIPLLARIDVAGPDLSTRSLLPPTLAWVCVVVGVPIVSMATTATPQRPSSPRLKGRRGDTGSVHPWRVVPLVVGFALCWSTRSPLIDKSATLPPLEVAALLVGIALLAIGIILVVPVFVTLVASLVLGLGRGPLATLTGRRLQTQPAAATRVIAVLMMGLFIVVGARGVMTAFLSSPQYTAAADFVERSQTVEVTASPDKTTSTADTLRSLAGVERVTTYPVLYAESVESTSELEDTATVLVASCADLTSEGTPIEGCSDSSVSMVGQPGFYHPDPEAITISAIHRNMPLREAMPVSMAGATTINTAEFEDAVGALSGTPVVVIPPDFPGVAELLPRTDGMVVAHAGPGRFLYDRVEDAGFRINSYVDLENYDFVQGMLTLVWTLAAVIISLGLLSFTVVGIDRALSRRRELTSLRLIGTPGRLLRQAQWLEAALPTVFGSLLAIAAGGYAGATYLQLDGDRTVPLTTALALAFIATVTSILLAWITTIGTTARLDPEHIRTQ